MNIYETQKGAVDSLYSESLHEYFEETEFHRRIKFISDEFEKEVDDVEERLKSNYFKKSCLHKVFKVHERIKLVRHFEDQLNGGMDFLPRFMYPGLKTYLLLTCFDQLGQDDKGWRFFPNWLDSKKHRNERNEILSDSKLDEEIVNANGDANPRYIKAVYNKYYEIYGVKNSFMNFLRYLLPEAQRSKLLDKILIEFYSVSEERLDFDMYGTELDKEKWLYQTRNNYTHNLLTVEKHFKSGYLDVDDDWIIWEEIHSENEAQRILARDSFKDEIEKSILIGIVQTIKNNS